MSPWSWAILICTLAALVFSWHGKVHNCVKTSSILLFAFLGTRLITEFVSGPRFMFDMSNDLVAVVLLVVFVKESLIARGVIAMYAFMTIFAYIPSTVGYMPIHTHHIIIDALAFIQIFILFGGIIHGYTIYYRQNDGIRTLADGGGGNTFIYNSRPERTDSSSDTQTDNISKEDSKEVKIPTYGRTAVDFWKVVK